MYKYLVVFLPMLASCGSDTSSNKSVDAVSEAPSDTAQVHSKPKTGRDTVAARAGISPRLVGLASGDTLQSPADIRGSAPGTWYFEAQFILRLHDSAGKLLAMAPTTAQGEWMTESYVSFEGRLKWKEKYKGPGILVLEAANPSGDKEREKKMSVPVWVR